MARLPSLSLSGDAEADKLLSSDPLALLIGMVLDQQIPLERAFAAPAELRRRLDGTFDAATLAAMHPEALAAVFSSRPALHRFPGSMAARVQELCKVITEEYGGRADGVWKGAKTGQELITRVQALPGFGAQKAKIFVALLGKQRGVQPPGWQEVSHPYGDPGTLRSIADIVDSESLDQVRAFKKQMKAAAAASTASASPAKTAKSAKTTKAAKTTKTAKAAKARR